MSESVEEPLTNFTESPEGAIATLGIVVKALGGEVRIGREVLDEGFEDGDYVDVSFDTSTQEVIVSVLNRGQ